MGAHSNQGKGQGIMGKREREEAGGRGHSDRYVSMSEGLCITLYATCSD